PSNPASSSTDQQITVSGSGFQSGLTVTAFFPGGGSSVLSGTQITSVTSTSLQLLITFGNPGTWGIRINNPDGGQSGVFSFVVAGSADFSLSVSGGQPVAPGVSATFSVTINAINGFNASVATSCTAGFPANTVCFFSPSPSLPGTVSLTVTPPI